MPTIAVTGADTSSRQFCLGVAKDLLHGGAGFFGVPFFDGASGGGNSRSARALPKLRAWVRALRPLAQGNLAPFILVGAFEGRRHGHAVDPVGVALALLWGVMDHGAIVLANDLGDEEADRHSRGATLLSGGSRVLVDGALGSSSLARG